MSKQENHQQECEYELITCKQKCCDLAGEATKILRKDLDRHLQEDCSNRLVDCEHCSTRGEHWDITGDHLENCTEVLVECTNEGCEEMVKRCDLKHGQHAMKCGYAMVECKYADFGCEQFARKDLPDHEKDLSFHLEMTCKTIRRFNERLHTLEKSDQSSKSQQAELLDKVKNLEQTKRKSFSTWFALRKGISKEDPSLDEQGMVVATFKMKDYACYIAKETTFHSPPFYTSLDGYKMIVKVRRINNKLSIYVEVMPGENDDNLEWPVDGMKVEVQILSQDLDNNHFSTLVGFSNETQKVDKKPVYNREGFDAAVSMGTLTEEYTRNNTLYFRVTVYKTKPAKPWLVCSM